MASKVVVTKSKLNNIGDAIREKLGKTQQYSLDEMPVKIRAISGSGSGSGATVTITTETEEFYGKTVTLTDGHESMTASFSNEGVAVFQGVEMEGELTVSVTVDGNTYEAIVEVQTHYNVALEGAHVYGAYWDGSSTSKWTRTDLAADFEDPEPAENNGTGSSPFDNIYPWSGMVRVDDPEIGAAVKIPKFYFKLSRDQESDMRLQISDKPLNGFHTCPACADRGDGNGERDYMLIGRYKCGTSYKSQTGNGANYFRPNEFRTNIHNLGSHAWMCDISTYMTIWMLYLVEFADWNSQKTIGYGCFNNPTKLGYTDSMQYHTGSVGSKTGYTGEQYRNIEGLWDNKYEFCDGIYAKSDNGIYVIKNPADFSFESGGTLVGTRLIASSKYITSMSISDVPGFEWFMFPNKCTGGSENTYICDTYSCSDNTYPVLMVSNQCSTSQIFGLFTLRFTMVTDRDTNTGARPMKLP